MSAAPHVRRTQTVNRSRLLFALLALAGFVAWSEEKVAQSKSDHWAFKPAVRPAVPAVKNRSWPRNPIDYFVLARLEKEGLIERRRDPHDRRVTRITVTPVGHRLLAALRKVADAMEAEVRSLLTPAEHEVVARALSRLHAHMKALRADPQEEREVDVHAAR